MDNMKRFGIRLFLSAFTGIALAPTALAIDWNWPNNMIPSDQKSIDKAYAAYQDGDVDTAILTLNGIKGAQNNDCRARHILAEIYLDQKRYSEAKHELMDMYNTEIALEKANTAKIGWVDPPQIRMEYADACAAEGSYPEAINIYRELTAIKPVNAGFAIGKAYNSMGEHEQARNQFKHLLESGIKMTYADRSAIEESLAMLNKHLDAEGKGTQTVAATTNEVRRPAESGTLSPMGASSGHSSSYVAHTGYGTHIAAPAAPKNSGTTLKAGPVEDAANDIRNRKFDSAITRLKDVLTRQPKNGQAYYLLAVAYASSRQFVLARDAYEKTLEFGDISLQKLATVGLSKLPKNIN